MNRLRGFLPKRRKMKKLMRKYERYSSAAAAELKRLLTDFGRVGAEAGLKYARSLPGPLRKRARQTIRRMKKSR